MASPEGNSRSLQGGLRASDADRERVAELLREHYGAGRLSDEDLSERVEAAYGARTTSELAALTADLPSGHRSRRGRRRSRFETSVRTHLAVYLVVNVMLIGIWAASGGGYFWPIWPILGWGIGVGCHAAPLLARRGTRPSLAVGGSAPASRVAPLRELDAISSVDEMAASVPAERPSLRPAAAPDGTVTILFSDIEGS